MRSKNRLVLNHEISISESGDLPLFIPILPAGKELVGKDGRKYLNPDPLSVILNTKARGTDTPIDFNHNSEQGDGRAVGWIKDFVVKSDGSIWGEVSEWSMEAQEALRTKAYRYLSPAFYTNKDKIIVEISSVGLVNSPNLDLPAINKADIDNARSNELNSRSDSTMDPKEIRKALGLEETATDAEVTARINELSKPPKPELNATQITELVNSAVKNAVAPLIERNNESHADLAKSTIENYIKAGKIPPSDETRQFWLNQASTPEGLKKACEYLDQLPQIVSTADLVKGKPNDKKAELNSVDKRVCKLLNISEEEFTKTDLGSIYGESA